MEALNAIYASEIVWFVEEDTWTRVKSNALLDIIYISVKRAKLSGNIYSYFLSSTHI